MVHVNVCAKCNCDVLRWESEKWKCFECGHASDGLKTITMPKGTSRDRGFIHKQHNFHHGGQSFYIPTHYEEMKDFKQFITMMEEQNG
jgi:hypothetical protein